MDRIKITNLEIYCNHGVFKEEKLLGQKFVVSAELYTDTYQAGMTDDLKYSIDYGQVCHMIDSYMKENTFNLIEAVAENLATHLLTNIACLKKLILEIKKPNAPIDLPFENVSVQIERAWNKAYIAYGSNMGDSRMLIERAISSIEGNLCCKINRKSTTIVTKPYGGVEQDDFLNGCIEIETLMSPDELLDYLHVIEQEAGRERKIHWGPRTLDLDILLYNNEIINKADLTVPHIDMQNRMFVLEPLNEIAPYAYHPVLRKTVNQLYNDLNNIHSK